MENKIPKSEKPYLGLLLDEGLNTALKKATGKMGMTRSAFARYCLMKTLQELSLISAQVKGD